MGKPCPDCVGTSLIALILDFYLEDPPTDLATDAIRRMFGEVSRLQGTGDDGHAELACG